MSSSPHHSASRPSRIIAYQLNEHLAASSHILSAWKLKLFLPLPFTSDPSHPTATTIDGTIAYCADLKVEPEDIVMLAVAWLTKAPTMGKFDQTGWIEGWKGVR